MPESSGEEEDALHLNDFLEMLEEAKIPDDIYVNGPLYAGHILLGFFFVIQQ